MNIILLSSVYPSKDAPKGTTPVVHYFAKEWVSMGHRVHVFHTESGFPKLYYWLGRCFKKALDTRLGHLVPVKIPTEYSEIKDGVTITHLLLKKYKPHGRFSHKQIQNAFLKIVQSIDKEDQPDCLVGHWDNPQLELLYLLKEKYNRPSCLVYHNNHFNQLRKCYGNEMNALVDCIDLVGFRNITAQSNYEMQIGKPKHSFIAASGVSHSFIEAGLCHERKIISIDKFIYVGSLIKRKYPTTIISALSQSYQDKPFKITYIGEGDDKQQIQQVFDDLKCNGELVFTGRIPRNEVIEYLKRSDVFVMISRGEIFGLVYLEAMALGCITIAARHEGIDGIIEDGVNGFLCEAGNADELASIITRLRQMRPNELMALSNNAKQTANKYTDVAMAKAYLQELEKITV